MTEPASSESRDEIGTDFGPSAAVRSRLDELQELSPGHLEDLLDGSPEDTSEYSPFSPLTSTTGQANGDSLLFQPLRAVLPRVTHLHVEQEFEGIVFSVNRQRDSFVARLADLTAHAPDEEAEIAFAEISPDDRSLVVPGALFSWFIGRSTETSGQVRRVSEIRFRRSFGFAPRAIERAKENAARMLELLNEDDAEQTGESTGSP